MAGKDIVKMSQKELLRLHVIHQVIDGKIKQIQAAGKLGLSDRQVRRIIRRIEQKGDSAIAHKSRGRISPRRIAESIKNKVLQLCRVKYKGFGPTFASEKLFEIDKIRLSDETLRLWLIEEGLWQKRRVRQHRHWRVRKTRYGEMVQFDGSHHDWLEGRGPKCVLMGYIDDATNKRYARFYEYEGVKPAMDSLKHYIKRNGIPYSIYLDRHPTYKSLAKPTVEDELNNRQAMSQYERAANDLGISLIHAASAPAKGRIERDFKTYQDRLVKEMRLRNISSIAGANKYLPEFLLKHNLRFSFKATEEANLHRPLPEGLELDTVLCVKNERTVRNDFTIVHECKLYQILDRVAAKTVTVEEHTCGSLFITYKGQRLRYKQILVRPDKPKPPRKMRLIYRPPLEHPFKRRMYEARLARLVDNMQLRQNAEKENEALLVKT